jgi:hypothetical protein
MDDFSFWIHRYTSTNRLSEYLGQNGISIPFTLASDFWDFLEGAGKLSESDLSAMITTNKWKTSMLGLGYSTGTLDCLHQSISDLVGVSNKNLTNYQVYLQELYNFWKRRRSTYISCWFKSNDLDIESRYMWELYGNRKCDSGNEEFPIRISIHLPEIINKIADAGLIRDIVKYTPFEEGSNPFFYKDASYQHEQEFRIISEKNCSLDLGIDPTLYITTRSNIFDKNSNGENKVDEIIKSKSLEYNIVYKTKRIRSSLFPEFNENTDRQLDSFFNSLKIGFLDR